MFFYFKILTYDFTFSISILLKSTFSACFGFAVGTCFRSTNGLFPG